MYYPIGWQKVLKLDNNCDDCEQQPASIISIQANHQRELFLILTTRSFHIWYSRPTVEIVRHKRSQKSIDEIGHNKLVIWKTDSSEIVVATDRDQLLFYHVRPRNSTSSGPSFLLSRITSSSSGDNETLYNLNHNSKTINTILRPSIPQRGSTPLSLVEDVIPALDVYSFGKLDLSIAGVSCLMSAEEQVIVATRGGNIFGVYWNGNIDDRFPWSLKNVQKGVDYVTSLKFSSVISGFAMVFYSGKAGFMPVGNGANDMKLSDDLKHSQVNYFQEVNDAVCVEVNHRYRLVAMGTRNSNILVCNLDESNANLILNHKLQLQSNKSFCDATTAKLGSVVAIQYSVDGFALVTCWECGEFAIWSVFGSLLFCTQQWQLESQIRKLRSVIITSMAWGREGYSLWFATTRSLDLDYDTNSTVDSSLNSMSNGKASSHSGEEDKSESSSLKPTHKEEIHVMSLARSASSSSPHLACSSDAIILLSEDRIYIGPSVPHEDKFDHWLTIDFPLQYSHLNWPIKYATSDRESKNIAVAGGTGFAVYSLTQNKWRLSTNTYDDYDLFTVCGDIIWWKDYLIFACFNLVTDLFEIRGYDLTASPINETSDNEWNYVSVQTRAEITSFSIFESRLLALYVDGTLGMFMLNLRKCKPKLSKKLSFNHSSSTESELSRKNSLPVGSSPSSNSTRSDSIMSSSFIVNNNNNKKNRFAQNEISLQISPIENLVISNLLANSYCISSIALTRLHFKNNRDDDSILLNACGKLFLLEREVPNHLMATKNSPPPVLNSNHDQSLAEDSELNGIETRVQSAMNLSNSIHFATASFKSSDKLTSSLDVTFKAVSVIATNVEQFWISPEISVASELSYFKKSLWMFCGGSNGCLQVWLPLLNDKNDLPTDLYVPDRIMLPIKCDIYPLAIRSSARDVIEPDDAIVLGAESDILFKDHKMFSHFPYCTVKRQCRVYLHKILRELLLNQHLGYYARKIAESCHNLPYFAHCLELLLHEVLEEEATSPVPLPDPMLPQVVKFIKEFPVYLETVVHCARKSELSMWSHLFDERAVGNPRRLFQECLEKNKLDTAASCLIILQSLDRNIVSQKMVRELMRAVKEQPKFNYLIQELETFMTRAELDYGSVSESGSPTSL